MAQIKKEKMAAEKKSVSIFCVADPEFENDNYLKKIMVE